MSHHILVMFEEEPARTGPEHVFEHVENNDGQHCEMSGPTVVIESIGKTFTYVCDKRPAKIKLRHTAKLVTHNTFILFMNDDGYYETS